MPRGEVEVDEARHDESLWPDRAVAERRHHPRHVEARIEIGAGDVDAVVREHVVLARRAPAALRRQPDHCEVGGTAADVDHQHGLLAFDGALVVERRRDRLELELDVPETRGACACRKRALRFAVALVVVVVEADRSPEHDGVERASGLWARPLAHRAQEERDDIGVAEGAAADRRRLVDEAAAEQALQRAHQPAGRAVEVFRDGGAPVEHGLGVFLREEHGARQRRRLFLEIDEAYRFAVGQRQAGVRGRRNRGRRRARDTLSARIRIRTTR